MGVVYEARQENPRRSVAIKVIRPSVYFRDSLRRFENEAQILGRLQHPGIAHIYEAGVAEMMTGCEIPVRQPFFAMEFIQGKPLSEYARDSGLDLAQRVKLFTRICDAVEHAHQAGIVHRDLKPANILITAEGKPKILDFGVARVTNSDVQLTTMHTDVAQVVGTLPYMSPEQVDGRSDRVDVRSDVYALGVILYELVASRLPYDLSDMPISGAARVIAESSPPSLGAINRDFRGDIATIVHKALEKSPDRRYQTVGALAADLRRYLGREPIAARPVSAAYHFKKFAQRNPALVGAVAATFVALVAGVIGTTTFALRERDQADLARVQSAQAQAITDFLRDMLASVDPANARGQEVSVRQALDEAARRLASGELAMQPEVEAALQHTIGETYVSLGHPGIAKSHLESALDTRRKMYGTDHPDTIDSLAHLATVNSLLNNIEEAERQGNEVLRLHREIHGDRHAQVALALESLSVTMSRAERNAESETLRREALSIRRQHADIDPRSLASCLSSLGAFLTKLGEYEEAESPLREALAIRRELLGADHPELAYSMSNLGSVLHRRGELVESEELLTEALTIRKRILDSTHPDLLLSMNNLAMLLMGVGRRADAIVLMRQIVETQREVLGEDNPDLGKSLLNLASTLSANGELEQAGRAGKEGLDVLRRAFGDRHPNVASGLHNLAAQYMKLGRIERAEPLIRESIAIFAESLGDQHPLTSHCRDTLGTILVWRKQSAEAVTVLERALADRVEKLGASHAKVGLTWKNIAAARLELAEYVAARDAAQRAVDILQERDPVVVDYRVARLILAEARIRLGDATDAVRSSIEESRQALESADAPRWMIADADRVLGLWLAAAGRSGDAAQCLQNAADSLDCSQSVNPFACDAILRRIGETESEWTR